MTDAPDYKYVLGMDPGGTTGIAMLRYTDTTQPELIYLHQQENGLEGFYNFFNGTNPNPDVTIVSESFTIREGVHGADVTPLRIEGAQYVYWGNDVVYQEPAMKSLIKESWLKEQNLWTPGKRHQMDALIHALVYLRNEMHEPTLKNMSGDSETPIAEPGEAQAATLGDEFNEQVENIQQELKDSTAEILAALDAFEQMFGGAETDQVLSPAEQAMAQGRPQPGDEGEPGGGDPEDGESEGAKGEGAKGDPQDGVPNGSGGNGGEPDESRKTEIHGTKRKRTLNGAFTGFDED